jgi:quinol monooxygenase YgiN
MARDPGCLQFDFAADLTSPVHFLTYEVFTDETAFKAHLESAHMAEFRAAVKDLVVGRRVEGYQLVSRPSRHPKS